MLRIPSRLPVETEELITQTIGCCIEVHRALGPGLLESIYSQAVCIELAANGIPFEREKRYPVTYRDRFFCHQRLDIVVGGCIVLELKSIESLSPVHHAQVLSYLRVSRMPVGLLINFNVAVLPDGLKRIVL
jgi:GxxExxY protein